MTEILNQRVADHDSLFMFNSRQRVQGDKFSRRLRPTVTPTVVVVDQHTEIQSSKRNLHRFNDKKKQHSAATTTTGTTSTTRTSSAADSNQNMTKIVKLPPPPPTTTTIPTKPNSRLSSSNLLQSKNELNSGSNQSLATTSRQNQPPPVAAARREQSNVTPVSSLTSNKQPFFEYVSSSSKKCGPTKSSFRPPSSTTDNNNNKDSLQVPRGQTAMSTSVGSNLESIELIKINKSLKSKLYSSYLIYSSATNPFSSNYDLINKENPDFYESLCKGGSGGGDMTATYRFNRAASSHSLAHNYMDKKKFEAYLNDGDTRESKSRLSKSVSVLNDEKMVDESQPPAQPSRPPSRSVVASDKMNEDTQSHKSQRGGERSKTSWSAIKRAAQQTNLTRGNNSSPPRATATQMSSQAIELNQFLNYRKEPKKEEEAASSRRRPNTALLLTSNTTTNKNNNRQNRNDASVGKTAPPMSTKSNNNNNNTAELYLDPVKLAYIKSWVQRVNQVQAVEGKCTETINKILFYD